MADEVISAGDRRAPGPAHVAAAATIKRAWRAYYMRKAYAWIKRRLVKAVCRAGWLTGVACATCSTRVPHAHGAVGCFAVASRTFTPN